MYSHTTNATLPSTLRLLARTARGRTRAHRAGHVPQSDARAAGRPGGAHVLGHRRAERASGVARVLGIVLVRHGDDAVRVRHMDHSAGGEHHAAGSVYYRGPWKAARHTPSFNNVRPLVHICVVGCSSQCSTY